MFTVLVTQLKSPVLTKPLGHNDVANTIVKQHVRKNITLYSKHGY